MATWASLVTATLRGVVLFLSRCIGPLDVLRVSSNFCTVVPGVLYRSGTMSPVELDRLIARHRLSTVINLRGGSGEAWHALQRELLAKRGLDFVELKLSSHSTPSLKKMQALKALLAGVKTPALIHCRSGADRTGLAAAIYQLSVRGCPLHEARASLSFRFGHFPWLGSRTAAMGRALALFAEHHGRTEPVLAESPAPGLTLQGTGRAFLPGGRLWSLRRPSKLPDCF